jgi:hypothetical protein
MPGPVNITDKVRNHALFFLCVILILCYKIMTRALKRALFCFIQTCYATFDEHI